MFVSRWLYVFFICASQIGCATVRQEDLRSWEGISVQKLDAHPVFISMPVYKTKTEDGTEIRNYVNSESAEQCFANGGTEQKGNRHVRYSTFMTCSENRVVCNNIFYIRSGTVVRYAPTGSCYTNESVRPRGNLGQ